MSSLDRDKISNKDISYCTHFLDMNDIDKHIEMRLEARDRTLGEEITTSTKPT